MNKNKTNQIQMVNKMGNTIFRINKTKVHIRVQIKMILQKVNNNNKQKKMKVKNILMQQKCKLTKL